MGAPAQAMTSLEHPLKPPLHLCTAERTVPLAWTEAQVLFARKHPPAFL